MGSVRDARTAAVTADRMAGEWAVLTAGSSELLWAAWWVPWWAELLADSWVDLKALK